MVVSVVDQDVECHPLEELPQVRGERVRPAHAAQCICKHDVAVFGGGDAFGFPAVSAQHCARADIGDAPVVRATQRLPVEAAHEQADSLVLELMLLDRGNTQAAFFRQRHPGELHGHRVEVFIARVEFRNPQGPVLFDQGFRAHAAHAGPARQQMADLLPDGQFPADPVDRRLNACEVARLEGFGSAPLPFNREVQCARAVRSRGEQVIELALPFRVRNAIDHDATPGVRSRVAERVRDQGVALAERDHFPGVQRQGDGIQRNRALVVDVVPSVLEDRAFNPGEQAKLPREDGFCLPSRMEKDVTTIDGHGGLGPVSVQGPAAGPMCRRPALLCREHP